LPGIVLIVPFIGQSLLKRAEFLADAKTLLLTKNQQEQGQQKVGKRLSFFVIDR
jgi:hypothetical protein